MLAKVRSIVRCIKVLGFFLGIANAKNLFRVSKEGKLLVLLEADACWHDLSSELIVTSRNSDYLFFLLPALHPLSFDDVMVFPCGKESARLGLPPPPASG